MNVPDDLSSLDDTPRARVPWSHPDADPVQDVRDFIDGVDAAVDDLACGPCLCGACLDDEWTFDAQVVAHEPVDARLAALGRWLVRHPHLALVALRVPLLGRLVAAAAEAEWRDVLHGERKLRGLD